MSWKEVTAVKSRHEFVLAALGSGANISELCREAGISRRVGYKWIHRFKQLGIVGLEDQKRGPRPDPDPAVGEMVMEIVRQRNLHPTWGPQKLRVILLRSHPEDEVPSERTIGRVLGKCGMVPPRRQRHSGGIRLQQGLPAQAPNDVWTIDFKGWWHVRNGIRCDPLTLRDEYSRYLFAIQALPSLKWEGVRAVMERVFEQYGMPKVIHSDNGRPFAASNGLCGLTKLSAWWLALGIDLYRNRPRHPQDNGGHERMHRDVRAELQVDPKADLATQQEAFDAWRMDFNMVRPHEALGQRTPAQVYNSSNRPYPGHVDSVAYPKHMDVRVVRRRGTIRYLNRECYLTEALSNWPVGLEMSPKDRLRVWFANVCLGETDARFGSPLQPPAFAASQGDKPQLVNGELLPK